MLSALYCYILHSVLNNLRIYTYIFHLMFLIAALFFTLFLQFTAAATTLQPCLLSYFCKARCVLLCPTQWVAD